MFPVKEFENRFREILNRMDALRDEADDACAAEMEELNADFEDALFVIECIDVDDEDWTEAFSDALAEFSDLCATYRQLANVPAGVDDAAARLEMVVRMAESNLQN